jgi:hypothetical protein
MANGAGAASSACAIRSKVSVPKFLPSTASTQRANALPSHQIWVFDESALKVAALRDNPPPQTWIVDEDRRNEQRSSGGGRRNRRLMAGVGAAFFSALIALMGSR